MSSLFVAWRSSDDSGNRWGPVARLERDGGIYRFCYTRGANLLSGFEPFPQLDDLGQVYESEELFPLFANRLLSRKRPEYEAFLAWGGFDPDSPPDPIAILSVTEGRRETDSIEVFPCPQPDLDGCYVNKFFVHGLRWMPSAAQARVSKLQVGERLLLMPDPCNEHDHNAVALRTASERTLIGYVPRYLARDVSQVLHRCEPDFVRLTVERVNADAPLQQRLLCLMRSCWPEGFQPCSGEAFHPIPQGVPDRCAS